MKKYFTYTWYVIRHKWFVFIAIRKIPRHWLFQKYEPFRIVVVLWRLLVHDMSKFAPSEFFPYVEFFHGTNSREQKDTMIHRVKDRDTQDNFDLAWLKHQRRNPHHWQYWTFTQDDGQEKSLKPPMSYIIEMICDWEGASRTIRGPKANVKDWYNDNKGRLKLHIVAFGLVVNYMGAKK